ncbi:vacuolar protein sorting-associated protein 13A-like isoform X2 [Haliotis rufescens]|uniref:vacuolar protein sorting-associated protein 13A-like isoform X2 n=1 Tax=Haliotis rufescens TaxID=6454 RepID=UPI00201EDC03|nr:vacuolar protein sorting-associated protein 13A-like isoform X2 [Haliotis rufescens]
MFESVVANLLNKYFGKYIQNLDASNLNVSILQGDAEFTDLQLRPEALSQLDLPIEVKAGYIGHLKLDIPWTSLFSSNIHLFLEDVYILAGPVADRQYDPARERLLQNAIKRQKLEALEKSALDEVVEKTEEEPGFYEKLATHFVSRIQVSVRNIHIRYEDTVTNVDHPFACGLMLKQIAMQSTDARWEPLKGDTTSNMLHKLLRLEDLSIYWNPYIPEPHLVKSRLNTDGWRNLLRMSIDSHSIFQEDFDFIIEPVTAQARLIISTENNSLPKVFADFTLEEIEVLLSRQQFLNLLTLSESFQLMSINQRYRKYHPNIPLKVSPRSWWHYANTAILEEMIRPYSWERIKEHRNQYRKYKDLYKRSLERPDHESIRSKMWELEENLDVSNILLAREHSKVEFAREAPERAKHRPKKEKKGWFSSWFGSSEDVDDFEITGKQTQDWLDKLSNEEKEKLYDGIGYDINANTQTYAPEYVKHKVQVILKSCCVSLVNYSKKILQVSVTHLLATWEDRPATGAFRISSNTESFSIEGASIEHELIPILTSDIGVYAPSVNQVCTLDFEVKPLYVDADYSLSLNIQPVEIVYDEHSISEVTAFFNVPHGGVDMRSAAMVTLQEVAKYSRAGLQYAIEQHKTVHVALNMRSPYIVVPEFGTLHRGGNVLIADFGTLRIESELQPKDVSLEDATMSEIESRLYDQFNITVSDVKVLLADSGDDWHTAQTQPDSDYHILPSVQLVVAFFNAVRRDYKQLPQQKLVASLPTMKLNISDKRLLLLMSFFRNFPIPASTSMATLGEDMVDSCIIIQPAVPLDPSETQMEPDVDTLRRMRRSVLGRKVVMRNDGRKKTKKENVLSSQLSRNSAGEEVFFSASDHSDEDVDEWSDFLHIKPVDDSTFPSNSVNILVRMTLGEFVINLSRVMDKHETPYLMFRVNRLRIDSALTVHGYAVHATLGGVQLVDKIHVGSSGEYMEILGTNSATDLVSIVYRKVEASCPDFSDGYGGVEHALLLKLHTMSALCDQASMIYLNAFIQGLITSVHSMDMKTSTSTVISSSDLNNKDRPSLTERLTSITDEVDYLPPRCIKLNMVAKLENLSLRLCDSENSLSHIDITGLESHILATTTRTTVRLRLKDMSIQDCSVGAIFPRILVIEDDSCFDLKFVKYNKNYEGRLDNRRQSQALDYSIRLRVGQLQTVYLSKFYWELIRFFEPFINPEMTEAARAAAMETVHRQVDDIQSQNVRISLNFDLRSPTILVPHDSKSTEMFMLNLGNLNIKNYFDHTSIPPDMKQEWNHIYVNLSSVKVNRVQLSLADDVCNILHNVLEPVSLKADIRMAIKPVLSDVKIDISGHLEKVKVNILAKDLQLVRGILQDNLSEGAPQPTSGIYESPTVQDLHLQHDLSIDTTTPISETRESLTDAGHKASTNFLFRFEGVSATLFEQSSPEEGSLCNSLCCMDMENINLSAISQSDGDLKVTFALTSLYIDDTRPDSDLANKRVLYCARKQQTSDELPLMSLIYKVSSDGNQKADLMVEKLRLNVSVPYAVVLYSFFQASFQTIGDTNNYSMEASTTFTPPVQSAPTTTLSVYGSLKQPEIVLYADPCNYDSRVIVLYADVAFEYRTDQEKQVFWSRVSNLQMASCIRTWDSSSKSVLLAPCSLEFTQKFLYDQSMTEMTVDVTKVNVYLSATVLQLLYDIYQKIQLPQTPTDSAKPEAETNDVKGLWKVKAVKAQRWLQDREDYAGIASALRPPETPKEVIKVKVEEINAMFEVENLDQHVPMLSVRTSLEGKVVDRLTKFHVEAEFHLEVYFFNERLSVWEPLVEPVCEKEGLYRPWEVLIKIIKAKGYPMACTYEDSDLDIPDCLQNEVQNMMHRSRVKSSSSETDTDSSTDMTIIRHRSLRRIRHGSDRSYESLSHHSSIQGESDSEPEGFIHNITNKLGSIFSSDSSDADISEAEEADDLFDPSLDKPVFITSRGPVHVSTGVHGFDEPDTVMMEEDDDTPTCVYLMVDSEDRLRLNITPQAISILRDVLQALSAPSASDLSSVRTLPAFELDNKIGVGCYITLHPDVKIHKDHIHGCTILRAGENKMTNNMDDEDDIEIITDEEIITQHDTPDSHGFVERALADAGHTLVSAGAFVFDDDDDYLSGDLVDKHRLKLQVDGFDPRPSLLHKRACRRLLPLTPTKNGTRYCVVLDIDMWQGRKVIKLFSPLQVQNSLTMSIDISCKTEDLKKYKSTRPLASNNEYTRLKTLAPQEVYYLPLFVAYHCPLFVKPADISYGLSNNAIWWPELMQAKEKAKYFMCMSQKEEKKSFNFKVLCKDGSPLQPPQSVPRTIPYYNISFHSPVTLHNYLPYDLQFSLEGTGASSSLTHGESASLYTVDLHNTFRLLITITDYLGSDWTGSLDVTSDMDEFKAISMETDINMENVNKHLSLSIHSNQSQSLDLYIYSPYWLVNKTELPLQLRGSMSDAMFECSSSTNPLLFRYKKHKRKKAKVRVYDSKWSQSFSLDTVGSAGVVVCHDKERGRKYMFMVKSEMSNLKLSKIITILPFFLVINCTKQKLRYMEENEDADLWFDLPVGECQPFWPTTDNYSMYMKYENSNVVSQHFPIKKPHNTVLRMDQGTALCVEVSGGTDSPITVVFTNYCHGDCPVRVENLCEDVFIKIHQKNQSQVTLLSSSQSVLYTWDEPMAERTLMWNVYGRKKPSFPSYINKDGCGEVRLRVQSLRNATGSMDVTDAIDSMESSPDDEESDEMDGLLPHLTKKLNARTRTDKMVIYWVSYLDRLQRVLLFTQDERVANAVRKAHVQSVDLPSNKGVIQLNEGEQSSICAFVSMEGLSVSVINQMYHEVALLSVVSSPSMWEVEVNNRWKILNVELATWLEDQWKSEQDHANLHDQIEADLVKMQMSKPFMGALRRTHHPGVWFQYRHSEHHMSVYARVQRLQLDNQLTDAYFPTLLCPAPIPQYILRKTGTKPFIELSLMRRTVPERNIDTFRYFKVLIQEFNICVDKGFVLSLLDVFSSLYTTPPESHQLHSDLLVAQRSLQEVADVMIAARPQRVYFEFLHLSPLKMRVSFSLNGTPHMVNQKPSTFTSDIVDFFLNSVGATLTEIKAVELRMAYFQRRGALLSTNQLLAQIRSHYTQQALQQAYVLVLGLDVLGNPYGLVRDFTQGLGDFFYEPFLGSIQGSDEFAESLSRGVHSLMGNTVGGAAGSVALVTGSLGNALASLSFDKDYKRKRRTRMQQQPRSLPATIVVAGRSMVLGVCLGFSGLVLDPVKGAHEEGVEGFFKGVGKGILGLLTKPTGGIVDMVSMAFDGLRRSAEMEDGVVARMRLPRYINPVMGLKPFSPYKSIGHRLLYTICKGEYAKSDMYWTHIPLSKEERADVLMITDRHLLVLEKRRFWGGWDVEMKIIVDHILGVPAILGDKLVFKVKQNDSSVNLFSGSEMEIRSPEPEILTWAQKQIENVIQFRQQ